MNNQPLPRLATERLILRPFAFSDRAAVERLAGAREVADTTLTIPHPYPTGGGADWIMTHTDVWERDRGLALAICLGTAGDTLVGAISLQFSVPHSHGELGYWIAHASWGCGYATEAVTALVEWIFSHPHIRSVNAQTFPHLQPSLRVLAKNGFQFVGPGPGPEEGTILFRKSRE